MTTINDEGKLTTAALKSLAERSATPSVSLFMPTYVAGREVRQNSVRFSNLVDSVEQRFDSLGVEQRGWFRDIADRLQADGDFWQHQRHGLAFFASPDHFETIRLANPIDELVFVGDRYHLRLLLPELDRRPLAVLALSQGSVALYELANDELTALPYDGPASVDDEQWFMDRSEQLQSHPTSQGGAHASFHAHDPSSYEAADRERFLRSVADSVRSATDLDLVVVATDRLAAEFSNHGDDIAATVAGSPDGLDQPSLLELVEPIVSDVRGRAQTERSHDAERAIGTGEAVSGVHDVLEAAITGRAAAVVLGTRAEPEWGRYDRDGMEVDVHDDPAPWDVDLLDAAVHEGLATGAEVGAIDDVPGGGSIVATLRY